MNIRCEELELGYCITHPVKWFILQHLFFWKLEIQYWAETSYGGEIKLGRILIQQVHQMAKTVENNHSIIFTHSILLKVIELHHHMWFLYIFTDIPELIYFAPELSSWFL